MDMQSLIHSQTDFSLGFTKEILEVSGDKNAVFSPVSLSVALSLAAGGAKGPTLDQFYTCLKFKDVDGLHEFSSQLINVVLPDGSANGGPLLSFVNGVWVDQSMTLKPSYRDLVNKQYNTEASSVDFLNKIVILLAVIFVYMCRATHTKLQNAMDYGAVGDGTIDDSAVNPSKSAISVQASIHSQTDFSLGFAKEIMEVNADKNAVFSPLSISVALRLAAGGAKGSTLEQFCTCLKFKDAHQLHELSSQLINVVLPDGRANGGPILSFVNGVWVDQSITLKPSYRDLVKKKYNTEASLMDFINKANEVRLEVNRWAADETNGKIDELLPADSVDKFTRLILTNALYFKGTWQKQFDSSATKEGTFNLLNGDSVQVPMMTTTKKQFIKMVGDCKIACLPYVQGQDKRSLSMYFILPDDMKGLPELEKKVDLNFLENHLSQGREVKVGSFQLPRFKISFSVEATEILKKIGLVLPFSSMADFTEMVDSPVADSLYISNVFHKSFVEVNEEGTEAAAANAVLIVQRSLPMDPTEDFIADHPFMFVIKEERTRVILFVGHVVNPLNS